MPSPQAVGPGRQVELHFLSDVEVAEVPIDSPKRSRWGVITAVLLLDCHARHWRLARGLDFQAKPARCYAEIQVIDREGFRCAGRKVAQHESGAAFLIICVQQVSPVA